MLAVDDERRNAEQYKEQVGIALLEIVVHVCFHDKYFSYALLVVHIL